MKRYMLDTNVVSGLLGGNSAIDIRMLSTPDENLCISAIVAAELMHGMAKRPQAVRLNSMIAAFLEKTKILPWDAEVALIWGGFRADLEKSGRMLEPHEMQIAAHAIAEDMILVSNNRAFEGIDGLELENWLA
jgi:tRNA(fMet)-specific endonuclease VapC